MNTPRPQAGLTMIELMITVAIFALLIAFTMPSFTQWIRDTQIRNQTESIYFGLLKARNEAVKRNQNVTFWLVSNPGDSKNLDANCVTSTTGNAWVVSLRDPEGLCDQTINANSNPFLLSTHAAGSAGTRTAVSTQPNGAYAVTFNGLGQVSVQSYSGTPLTRIDVVSASASNDDRNLRILVGVGGMMRTCDPRVTSTTDNRKCP